MKKKEVQSKMKKLKHLYDCSETKYSKEMKAYLIKSFFSQAKATSTCPYCNEIKPSIKKEGTTKFVMKEKEK